MYKLTIDSDKGPLEVMWSDQDNLIKWHSLQHSFYGREPKHYIESFYQNFTSLTAHKFDQSLKMGAFDLPSFPKIVDVGSGIAIIDLILYSYIPNSKYWLIDEDDFVFLNSQNMKELTCSDEDFVSEKFVEVSQSLVELYGLNGFYDKMLSMSENHPFYNSWEPVKDAISSSNFDASRFFMMSPENNITEEVDLIMSFYSWCWHYERKVYWDKLIPSLKKKGKLLLDILTNDFNDILEIDELMKCNSKKKIHFKNEDNKTGYRCLWVKNV